MTAWLDGVSWFERGGPVMWPLLALSLVTVTVVVERCLVFGRERRRDAVAAVGELGAERCLADAERRLAKGMTILDTVITAAPLLGILGTVLGIIECFQLLSAHAQPDPVAISGGVAEALITTATGLTVALCAILPYNWFRSRIRDRLAELERAARVLGEGAAG